MDKYAWWAHRRVRIKWISPQHSKDNLNCSCKLSWRIRCPDKWILFFKGEIVLLLYTSCLKIGSNRACNFLRNTWRMLAWPEKVPKWSRLAAYLLKSFTGLKNWRPQIIENGILLFRFESLYQTTSSTFERKIVWGHNSWRKMKRNGYLTTLIILHGFKQLTYLHFGAWFHPGKCDSENLH